jgi:hypothetical protein
MALGCSRPSWASTTIEISIIHKPRYWQNKPSTEIRSPFAHYRLRSLLPRAPSGGCVFRPETDELSFGIRSVIMPVSDEVSDTSRDMVCVQPVFSILSVVGKGGFRSPGCSGTPNCRRRDRFSAVRLGLGRIRSSSGTNERR